MECNTRKSGYERMRRRRSERRGRTRYTIPDADSTEEARSKTSRAGRWRAVTERGRTRSNEGLYTAYSSGQGCGSLAIPSHVNRLRDFQKFAMQNKRFLSSCLGTRPIKVQRASPSNCSRLFLASGTRKGLLDKCAFFVALTSRSIFFFSNPKFLIYYRIRK